MTFVATAIDREIFAKAYASEFVQLVAEVQAAEAYLSKANAAVPNLTHASLILALSTTSGIPWLQSPWNGDTNRWASFTAMQDAIEIVLIARANAQDVADEFASRGGGSDPGSLERSEAIESIFDL